MSDTPHPSSKSARMVQLTQHNQVLVLLYTLLYILLLYTLLYCCRPKSEEICRKIGYVHRSEMALFKSPFPLINHFRTMAVGKLLRIWVVYSHVWTVVFHQRVKKKKSLTKPHGTKKGMHKYVYTHQANSYRIHVLVKLRACNTTPGTGRRLYTLESYSRAIVGFLEGWLTTAFRPGGKCLRTMC